LSERPRIEVYEATAVLFQVFNELQRPHNVFKRKDQDKEKDYKPPRKLVSLAPQIMCILESNDDFHTTVEELRNVPGLESMLEEVVKVAVMLRPKCPKCGSEFGRMDALNRHMEVCLKGGFEANKGNGIGNGNGNGRGSTKRRKHT
jgi:hypothetical protein